MRAAGEDSIACEAAGMKDRIGEISNKTAGVAPLKAQGKVHGGFDGLLMGNFYQHDCAQVRLRERFELSISRREPDGQTLLLKRAMNMGRHLRVIAGEEDQGDE